MPDAVVVSKPVPVRKRPRARALFLYALAILKEFRWTLLLLVAIIVFGGLMYRLTRLEHFNGRPDPLTSVYGAWMALLAQPILDPPLPWHLTIMHAVYPLFGFILIGEGIVRLALLLMSRRHGEKEWMQVMASTYRDHIILCGLGHLGYRVFEQLTAANVDIVIVEIDPANRFLAPARAVGACILIRDMKDDQALIDAGIERARAIIVATSDDMANIEVAMDARQHNKTVRILLRLWDQQIAMKIAGAMTIDAPFSASALAAPIVAALSLKTKVLSSTVIGGIPHVVCELQVEPASPLAGKRIDQIEMGYAAKILARTPRDGAIESHPSAATTVSGGDTLVAHTSASQVATLAVAAGAREPQVVT